VTSGLKNIDWLRFLARPCLPAPTSQTLDTLREERILVTGAGGSIGSALATRLAALQPRELVLLDAAENRLSGLLRILVRCSAGTCWKFVLGDVVDTKLLDELYALHSPTIVFHAAAFKHVPLLEEQPFAAVQNNVLGTEAIGAAGVAHGARVILLSTDKAVQPTSVMGATKRVAEHVVLREGGTVVRLGNVLASSGSVAEVFARQMAAGEPLTVTDPAARRYFLTLDEAVNLLMSASAEPQPHKLLVPALTSQCFIADLARFMARELAPKREAAIEFTEKRPGDKEFELLWSPSESAKSACAQGLLSIQSSQLEAAVLQRGIAGLRHAFEARDLPALLIHLGCLIPDYIPSATVLRLAARTTVRVLQ
jgi:FlaA1/EpsC-like NDP-sugar epimerase